MTPEPSRTTEREEQLEGIIADFLANGLAQVDGWEGCRNSKMSASIRASRVVTWFPLITTPCLPN